MFKFTVQFNDCSANVQWGSQSKWEKIVLNTAVLSPMRREGSLRLWIIVVYIGRQINGKTFAIWSIKEWKLSGRNWYYTFHAVPPLTKAVRLESRYYQFRGSPWRMPQSAKEERGKRKDVSIFPLIESIWINVRSATYNSTRYCVESELKNQRRGTNAIRQSWSFYRLK